MLSVLMLCNEIQKNEINGNVKTALALSSPEEIVNFCKDNNIGFILIDTDFIIDSKFENLVQLLKEECKDTKVVYVSNNKENIKEILTLPKSDSLLSKDISYDELMFSLNLINLGYRIFPNINVVKSTDCDRLKELTPKELEVLDLICQAVTKPLISKRLNISENTLKSHIQNILSKTNYSSISKLALDLVVKGELDSEE